MTTPRIVLVTGSAQGIGAATAERLHGDGFSVVGFDRRRHSAPYLEVGYEVDLADLSATRAAVNDAGPIDVLVNNAAILKQSPFLDLQPDVFDEIYAVNLRAPVFLCQMVLPHMVRSGWGRIVNIASIAARTGGLPESTAYGASKAGLIGVTKNLAAQFSRFGVTINAIAPGPVLTAMGGIAMTEELLAQVPVGRAAKAGEIAEVVSFLIGDGASFITGATIDVNGGWVMA